MVDDPDSLAGEPVRRPSYLHLGPRYNPERSADAGLSRGRKNLRIALAAVAALAIVLWATGNGDAATGVMMVMFGPLAVITFFLEVTALFTDRHSWGSDVDW